MVITCGKCNTNYNIDAAKIPARGIMANCKKCGNRFQVNCGTTPPPMPQPPAAAPVSIDSGEAEMGLRPLSGLTQALRVLFFINIAVTAVAVCAGIYEYHIYQNLPPGFDINETLLPSDLVTGIVGLVQVVLFIILGITFLRWKYRANKNLSALSGQPLRFTPGWSVGWYFIPIANLFKPYQAMKEIWETSHKNQSTTSTVLGLWWAFWLISSFLGELAVKAILGADTVTDYSSSTMAYIASDGFDVVLNIVALMLVTRIGNAYSKNYCRPGTSSGGLSTAPTPIQPNPAGPATQSGPEGTRPI